MNCIYCEEEILAGETFPPERLPDLQNVHRECVIRMTIGSAAHQRGECSCAGGDGEDPPEMTKREAAALAYEVFMQRRRAAQ